jgi:hypothetical protein
MPQKKKKELPSQEVMRIGKKGDITIYRMDPDGSLHPIVLTRSDGSVSKEFPKKHWKLASIMKGSLQVILFPPKLPKRRKKKA